MKPDNLAGDGIDRDGRDRAGRSRWAVASLALSMLLASLGISIANVALPTLAQAFAAPFQAVQWVVIAYLLAMTTLVVGVGRLADILGQRRVMLVGIVLFTLASSLCGLAPTLWLLIAARAMQGLGAAVLMALAVALVRESVPQARTGSAMGLLGTMSAIGTALGPSLGGLLISGFGWRAIFLLMVLLGALNILLAWQSLPAPRPQEDNWRKGFDAWGTLLLSLTLATYALALTAGGGLFAGLNAALLLVAGLGAVVFLYSQTRLACPLIPLAAFRDTAFSGSLVMNALVATVMMTTLVVGPFYLSQSLGLNEAMVGFAMSVGPAVSVLSGVPAGRIVDRRGSAFTVAAGLVLMLVGCVVLATVTTTLGAAGFGVAAYLAAIAVLTPGYQLFQAGNNTAVMMDVAPARRGVVSGILSLSRNLGLITGASLMGAVFAFGSGTASIVAAAPATVASGMRFTFLVAAGLVLVALFIASGCRVARFASREAPDS